MHAFIIKCLFQREEATDVLCFFSSFPGSEGLLVLAEQVEAQKSHSASTQRGNGHVPEKMDFVSLCNKRKRLAPTPVGQNVVCVARQQPLVLTPVSVLLETSFVLPLSVCV